MLPVKRSTLETTRLDRLSTPDTMVLAKAAPGSVGMVGARPASPVVVLGADTVCPPPPEAVLVLVAQGR